MPFAIEFSPHARRHLEQLRKRDQRIVADAVGTQLSHEPDRPARHRKKLADNAFAPWQLRVGDFHVFHDVDAEDQTVAVAIGQKTHNRLTVGGEEIEL